MNTSLLFRRGEAANATTVVTDEQRELLDRGMPEALLLRTDLAHASRRARTTRAEEHRPQIHALRRSRHSFALTAREPSDSIGVRHKSRGFSDRFTTPRTGYITSSVSLLRRNKTFNVWLVERGKVQRAHYEGGALPGVGDTIFVRRTELDDDGGWRANNESNAVLARVARVRGGMITALAVDDDGGPPAQAGFVR